MEINIKCELPFAWCEECAELDLATVPTYSAEEGARNVYACKNAAYCEACEEAREYKKQEPDAAADDEWKKDAMTMMHELDEKISRLRTMNASADELRVMNASADQKPWEILGEDPYTEVADIIEDWCKRNKNFYDHFIVTIELDGNPMTELLLCETEETLKLVWLNDWYEGEKEIRLLGFRPICDFRVYGAPPQLD